MTDQPRVVESLYATKYSYRITLAYPFWRIAIGFHLIHRISKHFVSAIGKAKFVWVLIRTEVRQVAERQETLHQEVSDILKRVRRIDLKAGAISGDMVEIRGVLREHEAQLLSLIPE